MKDDFIDEIDKEIQKDQLLLALKDQKPSSVTSVNP